MPTAGSEQVLTLAGTGHDRSTTHVLRQQYVAAETATDHCRSRFRQNGVKVLRALEIRPGTRKTSGVSISSRRLSQ
jgi:hypothetical protein